MLGIQNKNDSTIEAIERFILLIEISFHVLQEHYE